MFPDRQTAWEGDGEPEEIEQVIDECTLEDAQAHLKSALKTLDAIYEERMSKAGRFLYNHTQESVVKAYNTVAFLNENPDRQHKEFTQADVQAAWQDGYEAGQDHPDIPHMEREGQ